MAFSMIFMVMLLGGGGNAGDLLDYTPTDAYWEMRDQRIIDADTMSAVLKDGDAAPTDKLMAIRALGELSKAEGATDVIKAKSLITLTPLTQSKEPFVAEYANRSIAWVNGKEPAARKALPADVYDQDLALLGEDSTIVGQMKVANGVGPIDLASMIPDVKVEGQSMRDMMMREMVPGILQAVQMIGNARADLVTLGMVLEDEENVRFMLVVRGQYDRVAVQAALEEEMGDDEDANFYSVGEVEVIAVNNWDPFALLLPSDDLFVVLFAEDREVKLPIDEVAKKLAMQDRKPAFSDLLSKQVNAIDRDKADIWAAMQVTPIMKEEPEVREFFGAFDAGRALATRDTDGMLDVKWFGDGTDEKAVKNAAEYMTVVIEDGIDEMNEEKQRMPPQLQAMIDPMLEMMASMSFNAEGKTMTGGMKINPNIGMTMPMMMMPMRAVPPDAIEGDAVEEAADDPF